MLRLRALQDSPSAFGSTYAKESLLTDADWEKRAADWGSARSVGYLAMDDTLPCGIAAAFLDEADAATPHLVSMWVAPEQRRRGVGQTLISAIQAWAVTRKARTLRLMVTSSNYSAIEFYKRLGFSMTGNTKPYPNDIALFEHDMERHII